MPQETTATSERNLVPNNTTTSNHASHHGYAHHEPNGLDRAPSAGSSSSSSSRSRSVRRDSVEPDAVDAEKLDERLRGLNIRATKGFNNSRGRHLVPGQRISEYENALTPPTPKQALGFKVVKRPGEPGGTLLTDIPNG